MEEKIPRYYGYIIVLLLLAVVAILAWKYVLYRGPVSEPPLTAQGGQGVDSGEKERQIQALSDQLAQARKQLDESSGKVAELQARLDDANKALSSTEQKLRDALRKSERQAASPAREKSASRSAETAYQPVPRRPAEPGTYEVIRPTIVFADPSDSSQRLTTIKRGTRVRVVGSVGDWLEVRSQHGNPPGYIRRDDAMFTNRPN